MSDSTDEAAIRAIIEARCRAVGVGNVDAMTADIADEVVIFDVVGPLGNQGKAASRERAEQWLGGYDGPVSWETARVRVAADGDVAFSHGLSHVTGKLKTGDSVDMWFRTTLGFRRIDGRWRIVHDHSSDPFDPESGKALTGLKP